MGRLTDAINANNALGRQNLSDKGVVVAENATTREIMNAIAEVSGGGGTEEIETLIDNSGVLDSTEGSVEEKVEQLIIYSKLLSFDNAISLSKACDIETIDFYLDFDYVTSLQDLFRDNKHIKKIKGINTAKVNNFIRMFLTSTIEEVEMPFDFSGVTNYGGVSGTFQNAYNLRELRFVAQTLKFSTIINSPVLSTESIQSIIDGLATVTTAQTLTLHSAIVLTDEQKATINAKGWTLAQ